MREKRITKKTINNTLWLGNGNLIVITTEVISTGQRLLVQCLFPFFHRPAEWASYSELRKNLKANKYKHVGYIGDLDLESFVEEFKLDKRTK